MVGLVTVNYNNADLTRAMIASAYKSRGDRKLSIVVVDNRSNDSDRQKLACIKDSFPEVDILFSDNNLGYFRGLNLGIAKLRSGPNPAELVIIGNNDLEFEENFFETIDEARSGSLSSYPVVAPNIVTTSGRHQNPHVIEDISSIRMLVWKIYYSHYSIARVVHRLAFLLSRFSERKDYLEHAKARVISQGYGACYILTPAFFKNFEQLWAPTFLMGEEFFLSRQIKSVGMETYYDPSITVIHRDHASVGRLPRKEIWDICKSSYLVYMEYFRRYG